jgi:hypothetical protein
MQAAAKQNTPRIDILYQKYKSNRPVSRLTRRLRPQKQNTFFRSPLNEHYEEEPTPLGIYASANEIIQPAGTVLARDYQR